MKINKTLLIIIIIALPFFLKLCGWRNITHLSSDDLKWIEPFKSEQPKIFLSKDGDEDTMTTIYTMCANSYLPFKCSLYSEDFEALASGSARLQRNDTALGIYDLSIRKLVNCDTLMICLSLGECYLYSLADKNGTPAWMLKTGQFKIGRTLLDDCIIADSKNAKIDRSRVKNDEFVVTAFVTNKKLGLVYYKLANGEEFILRDLYNMESGWPEISPLDPIKRRARKHYRVVKTKNEQSSDSVPIPQPK